MHATVTIVTHNTIAQGAPDDLLLAEAFARLGCSVRFSVWNDPAVDWSATPLSIIRSTWDYHHTPDRWLEWIGRVEKMTNLVNPPDVLRWNTDKHYLSKLMQLGIATVPSAFIEKEEDQDLASLMEKRNWLDVVVKPAIGASAAGARRFRSGEARREGKAHVANLKRHGAVLVQPYVSSVEVELERSLVFIGGAFSHAFTKPAFNTDGIGGTVCVVHAPSGEEIELAKAALVAVDDQLPFARVDIVLDEHGPMLMELELIEPDLGLRFQAQAADRLAKACFRLA